MGVQRLLTRQANIERDTNNVYTLLVYNNQVTPMSKEAVFTMKLEPLLRAEFMAEAEATHRPASQVLRDLMREFVQRQRESREYNTFLQQKVDAARISMHAGLGHSNEEVELAFAKRRNDDTEVT